MTIYARAMDSDGWVETGGVLRIGCARTDDGASVVLVIVGELVGELAPDDADIIADSMRHAADVARHLTDPDYTPPDDMVPYSPDARGPIS